ncbi:putative pyrococcal protein [Hyperthermus butylicus DSM 5456]|uniref:Pyrococcal protein n=2 Tax=Hyperthermus butylicus TaxID=54248 RepID=A2BLJ3_HYPBU|nr:putative pyrococcal protein [Hyperthermus butylicus DSM 5456]
MEEIYAWHIRLPELSQLASFLILGYLFGYVLNTPSHYRLGFIAFGLASLLTTLYLVKFLPRLDAEERISVEGFKFRVDREFKLILLVEALITLAWSLAPEIVLLNYIVNVLGLTLFEAMLVEAFISLGAILATYISKMLDRHHRFKAMAIGYSLVSLWALIMSQGAPFPLVLAAHFCKAWRGTRLPIYRSWILSKIPREKASSLLSALSSYRKLIALASPAIAGSLAELNPTLPYYASLALFIAATLALLAHAYREHT